MSVTFNASPRRAAILALPCSFVIYVIPIVGPHAAFFLYEVIGQQFRKPQNLSWAAADLAVALGLQALAWALFYWIWRRRGVLPVVVTVACTVTAIGLAQYVYMLLLPSYFLIERDNTPETGTWAEVCTVVDASMMTWRTPRRVPVGGWQEVWVTDSHNRPSMLSVPDCRRTNAELPQPAVKSDGRADFSIGVIQVVPGGVALVQRTDIPSGQTTWLILNLQDRTLTPVSAPASENVVAPYLTDDGRATAWMLPVSGTGPPVWEELHVRPVHGSEPERLLEVSRRFGVASYEPVDVDATTGDIVLWAEVPGRLILGNMDGTHRAASIPPGVKPQSNTVMIAEHGVVAWDAYKEDGAYQISWATDAGAGTRRIPRGSSITAAAIDSPGRYVAFSTTTTLNIGRVKDTVTVVRTADGREVFRRNLPQFSRTNVTFVGQDYFAFSDPGATHVLRVPRPD
jgi:hypothetical protein